MKGLFAAVLSVLMMASSLIPGGKGFYETVKGRRDNGEMPIVVSVDCVERDTEEGRSNTDKVTIVRRTIRLKATIWLPVPRYMLTLRLTKALLQ